MMLNWIEENLVLQFLQEHSERLSNDGCNDWQFPAEWTPKQKYDFVKEYYVWSGYPEDFNPHRLNLNNTSVVNFLIYRMRDIQKLYTFFVKDPDSEWLEGYMSPTQLGKFRLWAVGRNPEFKVMFQNDLIQVYENHPDRCEFIDLKDY